MCCILDNHDISTVSRGGGRGKILTCVLVFPGPLRRGATCSVERMFSAAGKCHDGSKKSTKETSIEAIIGAAKNTLLPKI